MDTNRVTMWASISVALILLTTLIIAPLVHEAALAHRAHEEAIASCLHIRGMNEASCEAILLLTK